MRNKRSKYSMGLHIYSKYMSAYDSDYITAISIW